MQPKDVARWSFIALGCAMVFSGPAVALNPCEVADNGTGTVTLPPAGCEYLSPDEVHEIIDGLPPGTTIELAPIHRDFICNEGGAQGVCSVPIPPGLCEVPGGSQGGHQDCFDSQLQVQLHGTGALAGYMRNMQLPIACEVHTGPRNPGDAVQTFDTDMFRMFGQITGDPDFDLLRVTGGTDFGMPSPGHTTLTRLGPPGSNFAVDSFFDITYRIDFVGAPGGPLAGMSGSTTATIRMETGDPVTACEPLADGSGCSSAACPDPAGLEICQPKCANWNPATDEVKVTACECGTVNDCHLELGTAPAGSLAATEQDNPCVVTDDGSGTVRLPPDGCEYLSPDEVHEIIDGLPPGTTIELAPIHKSFICDRQGEVCSTLIPPGECEIPGGTQGGHLDCFESQLAMELRGTGDLSTYSRTLQLPVSCEVHTGPRNPGDPVQNFPTDMVRLHGELFGDPDFCLLRVRGGTDFGLPSPGHTTLTRLPGGDWHVDSFFDITYEIEFQGCPGGPLDGFAGVTTATITMATGQTEPPACVGTCPDGQACETVLTTLPDGTVDICCECPAQEPPKIIRWESVRVHDCPDGPTPLPIPLDPTDGVKDTTEPRRDGVRRIAVTFDRDVSAEYVPNVAATFGGIVNIGEALVGGGTVLLIDVDNSQDQHCYLVDVSASVPTLTGDANCGVATLAGDTNDDQSTNFIDVSQVKNNVGASAFTHPRLDYNLDCVVNFIDVSAVKNSVGKSVNCSSD